MSDTTDKILVSCPKCQKQYRVPAAMAGKQASCKCGTVFAITLPAPVKPSAAAKPVKPPAPAKTALVAELTDTPPASPAPVRASPTDCAFHPGTPALYACADCRKLLCKKCSFTQHDKRNLCSDCAVRSASPTLAGLQAFSTTLVAGVCAVHNDVEAVARCQYCKTLLCRTCLFHFPGGIELCARCATTTPQGFSRARRIVLISSLAVAGWVLLAAVGVILSMVFFASGMEERTGIIVLGLLFLLFLVLTIGPSIIGFGLACGAFDRKGDNPPIVWVSLVVNALMAVLLNGLFLVLIFRAGR